MAEVVFERHSAMPNTWLLKRPSGDVFGSIWHHHRGGWSIDCIDAVTAPELRAIAAELDRLEAEA